jgi:hypothetical protein
VGAESAEVTGVGREGDVLELRGEDGVVGAEEDSLWMEC